jgi:hypothetical protein
LARIKAVDVFCAAFGAGYTLVFEVDLARGEDGGCREGERVLLFLGRVDANPRAGAFCSLQKADLAKAGVV